MTKSRAFPSRAGTAPPVPEAAAEEETSLSPDYRLALRRVIVIGGGAVILGRLLATPVTKLFLSGLLGLVVLVELAQRPEIALALLVFFLPVFDIFPPDLLPVRGINFHTIIIALLIFGTVRLNQLRPGTTKYAGFFYGLLVLAFVGILQGVFLENKVFSESFADVKNWLGFMPFFFLTAAASRTTWGRKLVIWPLIVSCIFVSIHASMNYIAAGSARYRAAGLVGQQPNDFGAYLAIMLPVLVSLAVNGTGRLWSRLIAAGGAFVAGMALIFSQSRGAWVAFAAAILVMILVRRYVKLAAVVLVVAIFSSALLPPEFFDRLQETYSSPEAEKTETGLDPSAESRVKQWKAFPVLLAERPIFGHGLWTFPHVIYRAGLYHRPISPHSSIIRFGVEFGLVGLVFYFLFMGSLALGARRAAAGGRNLFEASLYAGLMGSIVALVIADASGARFFRGEIFGVFCIQAGLVSGWISAQRTRREEKEPFRPSLGSDPRASRESSFPAGVSPRVPRGPGPRPVAARAPRIAPPAGRRGGGGPGGGGESEDRFRHRSSRLGGAERQLSLLALGLARRGDQVSVACLSGIVEPYGALLEEGGLSPRILERSGGWDPRRLLNLRRWMREERHEVLCAFGEFAAAYAHFARPRGRSRPPLLVMLRRSAASFPRAKRALIRHVLGRAELVCVNSEAGRDYAGRMFGLSPDRIALLPNALPEEISRASGERDAARRELGLRPDDQAILYVGRNSPAKDIPTLCRTLALLRSRRPRVKVLVVGQGLESLPEGQPDPGDGVLWLGIRKDVPRLMAAADLLLLTSRSEGTPNVVLEAMAVGRPVVATSVGDLPSLLGEGPAGLLAAVGDEGALTAAVERLLGSADEREAMGRRGRELAERRFGEGAAVTRFRGLLSGATGGGGEARDVSPREGRS